MLKRDSHATLRSLYAQSRNSLCGAKQVLSTSKTKTKNDTNDKMSGILKKKVFPRLPPKKLRINTPCQPIIDSKQRAVSFLRHVCLRDPLHLVSRA